MKRSISTDLINLFSALIFLTLPAFINNKESYASQNSNSNFRCEQALNSSQRIFTSYLAQLYELRIINEHHLQSMHKAMREKNTLINPISAMESTENVTLFIHYEGLQALIVSIKATHTNFETIMLWLQRTLQLTHEDQTKVDEVAVETKEVFQKMIFYPVPAGHFQMGDKGEMSVTLTHSFETTSKLVTQKNWFDLMKQNPSYFTEGDDSIVITDANQKKVKMLPDHPVENITWWSAVVFANELSRARGFRPAYDISHISFYDCSYNEDSSNVNSDAENTDALGDEGKPLIHSEDILWAAARGVLCSKNSSDAPAILAPEGNIYLAEGYRLPTAAEQEYFLRRAGGSQKKYFFGDKKIELKQYAWYAENAEGATQAVGTLLPMIIQKASSPNDVVNYEFYDVIGNVAQWGHDWQDLQMRQNKKKESVIDPTGPSTGEKRGTRGGTYKDDARYLQAHWSHGFSPNDRHSCVGLRVVRSLWP